jgi:hypothetical protein
VFAVIVNDGQFQVAVEWGAGYRLPIHQGNMCRRGLDDFDLNQCFVPRPTAPGYELFFCALLEHAVDDAEARRMPIRPSRQSR